MSQSQAYSSAGSVSIRSILEVAGGSGWRAAVVCGVGCVMTYHPRLAQSGALQLDKANFVVQLERDADQSSLAIASPPFQALCRLYYSIPSRRRRPRA